MPAVGQGWKASARPTTTSPQRVIFAKRTFVSPFGSVHLPDRTRLPKRERSTTAPQPWPCDAADCGRSQILRFTWKKKKKGKTSKSASPGLCLTLGAGRRSGNDPARDFLVNPPFELCRALFQYQ